MDHLPQDDIPMLVSAINMLLRDGVFDNLDDVCQHYGLERQDIEHRLQAAGFEYSEQLNKIW